MTTSGTAWTCWFEREEGAVPADDPSGIGTDRAMVERIEEDGTAVLLVGPGRVGLHLHVDELPAEAEVGTWVVLDVQSQPPLVLSVDDELTRERFGDAS